MKANTTETKVGGLTAWVDEASGAPWARIVLLHGLGEHCARHLNTSRALGASGVEVVRFDFRGCGKSEGERQWIERFGDYVDDAVAIWRWARESRTALPTFLMGHSLGGAIAIHAAPKVADGAAGLVVNAPAFEVGEGVSRVKIAIGRVVNRFLPHAKIPDTLELAAISRDAAVVTAYEKDPLCCRFNTVRQGNEILDALEKIPDICREIRMPVLITHGEHDRLVGVNGSSRILQALASADKTLEVFPGGYHELHNDLCKDAYFTLLVGWLRAHAARKG